MEHTKGKWKVSTWDDTNGHCGWSIESDERNIATVYAGIVFAPRKDGDEYKHPDNKESIANARLIAAAPELLEACKEAIEGFENVFKRECLCGADQLYGDHPKCTICKLRAAIQKAEG
jgi:hypothetical protein